MRAPFLLCLIAIAVSGCTMLPSGCSTAPESKPTTKPALERPPAPNTPSPATYGSISPAEAKRRLASEKGIVLLDVRTPGEYETQKIPGSILIPVEPVDMITAGVQTAIPNKNTPVFIYCRSGRRSVDAAKILVKLGYRNVYDLGGISSWPYETIGADMPQ